MVKGVIRQISVVRPKLKAKNRKIHVVVGDEDEWKTKSNITGFVSISI